MDIQHYIRHPSLGVLIAPRIAGVIADCETAQNSLAEAVREFQILVGNASGADGQERATLSYKFCLENVANGTDIEAVLSLAADGETIVAEVAHEPRGQGTETAFRHEVQVEGLPMPLWIESHRAYHILQGSAEAREQLIEALRTFEGRTDLDETLASFAPEDAGDAETPSFGPFTLGDITGEGDSLVVVLCRSAEAISLTEAELDW